MNSKYLIDVFVNKHFEVEPFVAALLSLASDYHEMPMPTEICIPTDGINRMSRPRVSYRTDELGINVDVWCIEDLMPQNVNSSNSEQKYKVLPGLIKAHAPDFVISVSTAESTVDPRDSKEDSINGSVLFGTNYAMFDVHSMGKSDPDPNSGSYLSVLPYASSSVNDDLIARINDTVSQKAKSKFRAALNSPAEQLFCEGNNGYTSVGVVNVTNYKAYSVADKAAFEFCVNSYPICVCIETTHGIVNMSVKSAFKKDAPPVLFVSPITDRYLHFDEDVGTSGLQNYIAGYNAGIAVGELLMEISRAPELIERK